VESRGPWHPIELLTFNVISSIIGVIVIKQAAVSSLLTRACNSIASRFACARYAFAFLFLYLGNTLLRHYVIIIIKATVTITSSGAFHFHSSLNALYALEELFPSLEERVVVRRSIALSKMKDKCQGSVIPPVRRDLQDFLTAF